MALNGTATRSSRPSRFDAALLAAFAAGATVSEAAKAAGCGRRTAVRRRAALRQELEAARRALLFAVAIRPAPPNRRLLSGEGRNQQANPVTVFTR